MIIGWDIITIGNLSRNRYFGEPEDRTRRPTLCTCTLIRGTDFHLLVDPSLEDRARMAAELDRRRGLSLEQIDVVFLTHAHADHHFGLKHFRSARWLAAAAVAEAINASGKYDRRVEPCEAGIAEGVEAIPTPGHTPDHHSARFVFEGMTVVVAGDAVMTRDFWHERRGFFNSADSALAAQTIDQLARLADIVVPGHDNYLVNRHRP